MKILLTYPIITGIIAICLVTICIMFVFIQKANKFSDKFYKYIKEKHKELTIKKRQGSWLFITYNDKDYALWSGKCFKLYRKNPEKFADIIEAYLFEFLHVDKLKIQTESNEKEIPKIFS